MKLALCLAALLALPLAGLAQTPSTPATDTPSATVTPEAPTELVNSALDAPLFYELLLSELSLQNGDPATGYGLLLDAARKTNDAGLYQRAVDLALQTRAGDAALQAARAWRQAQPTSRPAIQITLQILIALNRVGEIGDLLASELAATPAAERANAITGIPFGLTRVSDKVLADQVVERVLAPYLTDTTTAAAAWTTVGRMRLMANQPQSTLEAIERAQSFSPRTAGPVLLALELMRPEQPQAEAIVLRYLAQADAEPDVSMAYARTLLETRRLADAQAHLQQLTRTQPDYAPGWLIYGLSLMQTNQPQTATVALQRYLALNANTTSETHRRGKNQALLTLSQIAEKNGNLAEASRLLDQVEATDDSLGLLSRRATLLAKQGKMEQAQALIQSYPEQTPADARLKLLAEAQLLREQQQYRAAFDLLSTWLSREPNDTDMLYEQALLAEKLDQVATMERLLRQVIALKPDYYHAYNALGYSLADRNLRLDEARQLVEKALKQAPQDPMIQDSMGWVEFRSGNYAEAVRLLRSAFQAQPDPEIAAHLGEALWQMNQRDSAQEIWKASLRLDPNNAVLRETLKRLHVKL